MKYKLYSIIIFLLSVYSTTAQVGYSPLIEQTINNCTVQTLTKLNRQLTGDTVCMIGGNPYTIQSRHWENPSNTMAAQFIYEQFQEYGYTPHYMDFSATGRNVFAVKTGTKYPNKKYIICSHYDNMPPGNIAPGADDNASGTCAVMEAARLLAPFNFDYTIVFIAFDEEERGLYGSYAYADSVYNKGDSIIFVFNYDMIAYDGNNDQQIDLISNYSSVTYGDNVKLVFDIYQPQLNAVSIIYEYMSQSDHWSFWQRGYHAFLGIEDLNDLNPYYHTVNDNYSHIVVPYFHGFTRSAIAALMTYGWDYFMDFSHTPIASSNNTVSQVAKVQITSPHPIAKLTNAPRLYYKFGNSLYNFVNAISISLDTFKFTIPGAAPGTVVSYYIAAQDSLGRFVGTLPTGGKGIAPPGTIVPPTVFTYSILTGISEEKQPTGFSLEQNYPNPFNPTTNIEFNLPKTAFVKLVVIDILGREVAKFIKGKLSAGRNIILFNASNLSSGMYIYSLYADETLIGTKKMLFTK
jgi:hypothetical protein